MTGGWLVYNRGDYEKNRAFADLFPAEARKRGMDIELKFHDEIALSLSSGKLECACETGMPAFAVNRTRDWVLGFMLEQAGCRVFNSSEVTRVGNDKAQSHLLAARLGLPQVEMAFCANDPASLAQHGLGYPAVLKNPYGHGGSEVFLAHDEAELLSHASRMRCDRVIVQRLCGRPGADVRVYALGGRILAAVKRESSEDFRANLSLGGKVSFYDLNRTERGMAERVLSALRPDYAGVDFIFDGEGNFLFNEVEDAVGARSLYRLGRYDVAGLYLEHIASEMK